MNDECRIVQEAISRGADGDRVTAEDAAHAKAHCAACADCSSFVSTLVALRRTPAPTAPPATLQRVLDAVRAEAAAAAAQAEADAAAQASEIAAAAGAAAPTTAGDPAATETPAEPAPVVALPRRAHSPAVVAGWIAGAAAVLFVAMLITAQGLTFMSTDNAMTEDGAATVAESPRVSDPAPEASAPVTGDSSSVQSESLAVAAASYVTYDGYAYRFLSQVEVDPADLPFLGTTRTALDSGGAPESHGVFQGDAEGRIVVDDNGAALAFSLVTRVLDGASYGLRSEPIDGFGQWPTLPAEIPEPSSADGSPTFVEAGTADGVVIYTRPGTNPEDGLAVGPGTPATDPAAGNPGWTWWEPLS
jgi:hypothetical protein